MQPQASTPIGSLGWATTTWDITTVAHVGGVVVVVVSGCCDDCRGGEGGGGVGVGVLIKHFAFVWQNFHWKFCYLKVCKRF